MDRQSNQSPVNTQLNVGKDGCFFKWLLIFLVFLLELKEPFIFKYAISFYVLASVLYMRNAKVVGP